MKILCFSVDEEDENDQTNKSPTDSRKRAHYLAIITLIINITLTLAKATASYLSGSLSIISSLVDSLVDITSGLVIWLTSRAIRKHDPYLYPVGRTRLEPIALVSIIRRSLLKIVHNYIIITSGHCKCCHGRCQCSNDCRIP